MLTPSGLDMVKPDHLDGTYVPAKIYRDYLEEFYDKFIEGQARLRWVHRLTMQCV